MPSGRVCFNKKPLNEFWTNERPRLQLLYYYIILLLYCVIVQFPISFLSETSIIITGFVLNVIDRLVYKEKNGGDKIPGAINCTNFPIRV